jgi:hypothetical protein
MVVARFLNGPCEKTTTKSTKLARFRVETVDFERNFVQSRRVFTRCNRQVAFREIAAPPLPDGRGARPAAPKNGIISKGKAPSSH